MPLIAVPRHEVISRLSPRSEYYSMVCVVPYNIYFTSEVGLVPLSDPDTVLLDIARRLDGVADLVEWRWAEEDEGNAAYMRVFFTAHENARVS